MSRVMPRNHLSGTVLRQLEDHSSKVHIHKNKKMLLLSYLMEKSYLLDSSHLCPVSAICRIAQYHIPAAMHTIWPQKGQSLVTGCQLIPLNAQYRRRDNVHWHSLIVSAGDSLTQTSYTDFSLKAEKLISNSVLPSIQTLRYLIDSSCHD